jgi:hypothetical protein
LREAVRVASDFKGIHLRTHRAKLSIDTFQVDENGTRYQERTWRVRQGFSRASVTAQPLPLEGMYSFAGEDYILRFISVSGTNIDGEGNAVPFWDEGLVGIGSSVYTVT